MKNEEKQNPDDVKAMKRAITNVYSRGTFNPNCQELNLGRARGGKQA